ncbi:unnamed protein product [Boreogadus saida]
MYLWWKSMNHEDLLLGWKPGCGLLLPHFYLSPECKAEDRVTQPREDVMATEGLTVSLRCTFKTTDTNAYLFWYKQQVNDLPRFMLRRFTIGEGDNAAEFHKDRFDAQIQNKSVPLRIQNLQLSDSALYYCALRPTVTGNTDSLYKNMLSRKLTSLFP